MTALATVVLALGLAHCAVVAHARRESVFTSPAPERVDAPVDTPRATAGPSANAAAAVHEPPPQREPTLRVEGGVRCPVEFAHADVLLARVRDTTLSGCDFVLDRDAALRRGAPSISRAEALEALVAEALFAHDARARGLSSDPRVLRAVRDALASALLRDEARARRPAPVSDAAVARYFESHRDEFTFAERVHLRAAVFASEADAARAIADLRAGSVSFEALVRERSIAPEARRDEGDLGLVTASGNDRVSSTVAAAGFALAQPGDVAPSPVRVDLVLREGRRRRARTEPRFFVLQLLARVPARSMSFEAAAPVVRARLQWRAYQSARDEARAVLEASMQTPRSAVRIDERALRLLRVAPR